MHAPLVTEKSLQINELAEIRETPPRDRPGMSLKNCHCKEELHEDSTVIGDGIHIILELAQLRSREDLDASENSHAEKL